MSHSFHSYRSKRDLENASEKDGDKVPLAEALKDGRASVILDGKKLRGATQSPASTAATSPGGCW
jgi:hypothetical protein